MQKLTLLLAALIIVPTTVHAQMRTDQLMWQCEASTDTFKGGIDLTYCAGYLAGINDLNAILPGRRLPKYYCIPRKKGVSNDQLRLIFLKWAKEHPAELHKTARLSAIIALSEAFPCKK